jgi:phosphomannomutase
MTNLDLNLINDWMANDVSEKDVAEITALLAKAEAGDAAVEAELLDRFDGNIKFGTAGLRGEMAAGTNRMNRATVRRAAFGLGNFAVNQFSELGETGKPKVVIGYDARHNSKDFAYDSAAIFQELGLDVWIFSSALPTPVLAYAIRALDAEVGVMVTASHNPGKDNGYKVYLGGKIVTDTGQGSQIIDPNDRLIAEAIDAAPVAKDIKLADAGWNMIADSILDDYEAMCSKLGGEVAEIAGLKKDELKITTTAMHGVGGPVQIKALNLAGFENINFVPEQQNPDPDFPTVAFPNPEEKGAMDMVIALADESNADLALANDPDADRLAAACFDKHLGKYRQLMGDEIGIILAKYFIDLINAGELPAKSALGSSIVSSRLVGVMSKAKGVNYSTTLTGHKWISRVENMVFGYEEAIGFCPDPEYVHDKDGPATGVVLVKIAYKLKAEGKNLIDMLDDIAKEFGLYSQRQLSIRLGSPAALVALVDEARSNPPANLGGSEVSSVIDMTKNSPDPALTQNAVIFTTADDTRVFVRPSGTEPKVKFYIETVSPIAGGESADFEVLKAARIESVAKLDQIVAELEAAYKK